MRREGPGANWSVGKLWQKELSMEAVREGVTPRAVEVKGRAEEKCDKVSGFSQVLP